MDEIDRWLLSGNVLTMNIKADGDCEIQQTPYASKFPKLKKKIEKMVQVLANFMEIDFKSKLEEKENANNGQIK